MFITDLQAVGRGINDDNLLEMSIDMKSYIDIGGGHIDIKTFHRPKNILFLQDIIHLSLKHHIGHCLYYKLSLVYLHYSIQCHC